VIPSSSFFLFPLLVSVLGRPLVVSFFFSPDGEI